MKSGDAALGSQRAKDTYTLLRQTLCHVRRETQDRFVSKMRRYLELFLDGNHDASWPLDHLVHHLHIVMVECEDPEKQRYFPTNALEPSVLASNPAMWIGRDALENIALSCETGPGERVTDRIFYEIAQTLTDCPGPYKCFDLVYADFVQEQTRQQRTREEPSIFVGGEDDDVNTNHEESEADGTARQSRCVTPDAQTQTAEVTSSLPPIPESPARNDQGRLKRKPAAPGSDRDRLRREANQRKKVHTVTRFASSPKRRRISNTSDDAGEGGSEAAADGDDTDSKKAFPSVFRPLTSADRRKMQETEVERLRRDNASMKRDLEKSRKFLKQREAKVKTLEGEMERMKRECELKLREVEDGRLAVAADRQALDGERAALQHQLDTMREPGFW